MMLVILFYAGFCYDAYSLDGDTIKYAEGSANAADYIFIGTFNSEDDREFDHGGRRYNNYYFKSLEVTNVLKAKSAIIGDILAGKHEKISSRDVLVKMPQAYKLLETPALLTRDRMEARRLSFCRSILEGTFKKHPNDNTYCEPSIEEINKKSREPEFVLRASLGYYLERGWDLKFEEGKRFLVYLTRDDKKNIFYIDHPHDLVPLDGETAEEIKSISFPE
jgi:hypothetical protein